MNHENHHMKLCWQLKKSYDAHCEIKINNEEEGKDKDATFKEREEGNINRWVAIWELRILRKKKLSSIF